MYKELPYDLTTELWEQDYENNTFYCRPLNLKVEIIDEEFILSGIEENDLVLKSFDWNEIATKIWEDTRIR